LTERGSVNLSTIEVLVLDKPIACWTWISAGQFGEFSRCYRQTSDAFVFGDDVREHRTTGSITMKEPKLSRSKYRAPGGHDGRADLATMLQQQFEDGALA